ALLRGVARAIEGDAEELSRLESLDTGKPLAQARADVAVAARYFDFYASAAEGLAGATLAGARGIFAYTLREPWGVTAHIIPWNYPMQISARTLAPALAAGNCCVLKPAEEAPLTALRLARLALDAGVPPGVLNVVPGHGTVAGAALAAHPGIDHLAFTGSQEVGVLVARAAAAHIVPVTLELGGKSPNVVFPDADLERATGTVVAAILQNAGQTCSAGSRLLVHRSIHDDVVQEIARRFEGVSIGRGLDDPDLGPLISEVQRTRVAALVREGAASGRLVTGGGAPAGDAYRDGFFFAPTLVDHVDPAAGIAREEVFGPVLVVSTFEDEDEAVALANGTDYGLIAAVWTRDLARAQRLVAELRVGQVFVNGYGAGGGVELPFGGQKRSGYGREKGFEALLEYSQLKSVAVNID
ncbi:MAG: Betaine-aldehyde dehydrogenase, partial [Solirubrobacterales bacterium]|nr:Betaine-aldehyde dehydrogenase [Solirubrobacterales bacterium]